MKKIVIAILLLIFCTPRVFADFRYPLAKVRVLCTTTTNVSVTNTTTETTLLTCSIPANALGTANTMLVVMLGEIVNNATVTNAVTFRLKYGVTTVTSIDANINITGLNGTRPIAMHFYLAGDGTTSAQRGHYGSIVKAGAQIENIHGQGSGSEDSTVVKDLVVTFQWDVANAGLTYTMFYAIAFLIS